MSLKLVAGALAVGIGLAGLSQSAIAAPFTYGGFTFEQDDTPDILSLLGNDAVLGGATFSGGTATRITRSVGFNSVSGTANSGFVGKPGFDPSLTLGRQGNAQHGLTQSDGTSCLFGCAINLPNGNNGTSTRHGLGASWSGGRTLFNGAGDDFVIYESASTPNLGSREAFMVRVQLTDGSFSAWRYEFVDTFEAYTETPAQTTVGATATAFDLSDFGLLADAAIQGIEIANLIATDLVDGAGEGDVNFGGSGNAPLSSSGGDEFGSGARDPDPLYIGILGSLEPPQPPPPPPTGVSEPGTLAVLGLGLAGLGMMRRRRKA